MLLNPYPSRKDSSDPPVYQDGSMHLILPCSVEVPDAFALRTRCTVTRSILRSHCERACDCVWGTMGYLFQG